MNKIRPGYVYVKVDLIDLSSIRWSPDGRWVAFASGYDIQILDASLPQGEQTAPVNLTKTDGWRDGFNLDWSPDSSRLAYFSHVGVTDLERPEGRSIPRGKASWELRVAEINGTGYTLLEMGASLPSFGPTGLAWAPGGERLAFTMPYDPDGLPRPLLYVINADGSGLAPLIEQPFASNDLSWSPDGDWLLFSSPGTGIWTLEVEAALRGAPALYQLTAAGDSVPAWQPSLGP